MEEYQCLNDEIIAQEAHKYTAYFSDCQVEKKASLFKVLGDLNRMKILEILLHHDQLCVYEISCLIDASIATTSHHLITLRKNNLIRSQKQGKHVLYSIANDDVRSLIAAANL